MTLNISTSSCDSFHSHFLFLSPSLIYQSPLSQYQTSTDSLFLSTKLMTHCNFSNYTTLTITTARGRLQARMSFDRNPHIHIDYYITNSGSWWLICKNSATSSNSPDFYFSKSSIIYDPLYSSNFLIYSVHYDLFNNYKNFYSYQKVKIFQTFSPSLSLPSSSFSWIFPSPSTRKG